MNLNEEKLIIIGTIYTTILLNSDMKSSMYYKSLLTYMIKLIKNERLLNIIFFMKLKCR